MGHIRLLPQFEDKIDPHQYAYRRGCSTEMHLQELMDFLLEAQQKGWPAYVASIDVDGAFDTVPHASLLRTFEVSGVALRAWLNSALRLAAMS